jgi:3-hydroxyisobutyrate dehydrogenase
MNIGWIGTGVMGASMAGHVQAAGHQLWVYNRTRAKAEPLIAGGATWCDSPAAVARAAEIVFTIVGYPADVEATYLGTEGVLSEGAACRIVVDMTTSQPALAQRIAAAAAAQGIAALDAPVSGGDVGARNGTLAIMVGGDRTAFDRVLPLFETMGKTIGHMGGAGAGQHTKLSNQILIANTMVGVCEALLYAERQGLDGAQLIDIIGKGAANSWSLNNLGPRILQGNFQPGFFVEHFVKDMGIALQEAAAANLALPGLALAHQLYVALKAQGGSRLGTQALMLVLRELNRGRQG